MNGSKASRLLIDDQPLMLLPRLALAIGLQEAIVLQQVHYWLAMHEKNQDARHFYEGRYWTYNSYAKWLEQFPFWSDRTLRSVFRNLEKPFKPRASDSRLPRGPLLLTGNFNREFRNDAWDRTKWYSIDRDELTRLDAAISTWQDSPNRVGKVAHIVSANSTGSKNTKNSASEKSSENAAMPCLPAGMAGSAAPLSPSGTLEPAHRALDLNLPIRYFRGRPASQGDLRCLKQTVAGYRDDFKYDVTQRDLNAAAVNARYWWDTNRTGVPRGMETFSNSLHEVVTPMLQAITGPSDASLRQERSLHPDLISPLSHWLKREPSPVEVRQVLQHVADWSEGNSRGLSQSWFDTLVEQLIRDWADTHRTIEVFLQLAGALCPAQQPPSQRRRATK